MNKLGFIFLIISSLLIGQVGCGTPPTHTVSYQVEGCCAVSMWANISYAVGGTSYSSTQQIEPLGTSPWHVDVVGQSGDQYSLTATVTDPASVPTTIYLWADSDNFHRNITGVGTGASASLSGTIP